MPRGKRKSIEDEIIEENKEEIENENEDINTDDEEEKSEQKEEDTKELTKKEKKDKMELELDNEFSKVAKFGKVYKEFSDSVVEMGKLMKKISITTKKMNKMYLEDIHKARHLKRKNLSRKPTGFNKERDFNDELLDLIDVPHGTKMSMPQYTKKLWETLKEKKLLEEDDARIIRVNDSIKTAFNLTNEQVKVMNNSKKFRDKNGLNFTTLQSYISKALNNKS